MNLNACNVPLLFLQATILIAQIPAPADAQAPMSSDNKRPFVNTLGMKFIPFPKGKSEKGQLLMSVWDTRVRDFAEFCNATGNIPSRPKFTQGLNDPAVYVSWKQARKFCEWLTTNDQAAELISRLSRYRLPTDRE